MINDFLKLSHNSLHSLRVEIVGAPWQMPYRHNTPLTPLDYWPRLVYTPLGPVLKVVFRTWVHACGLGKFKVCLWICVASNGCGAMLGVCTLAQGNGSCNVTNPCEKCIVEIMLNGVQSDSFGGCLTYWLATPKCLSDLLLSSVPQEHNAFCAYLLSVFIFPPTLPMRHWVYCVNILYQYVYY